MDMKQIVLVIALAAGISSCGNSELHGGNGGASPDSTNVNLPAPNDNNSGRAGTGTGADTSVQNGASHGSVTGSPNGQPTKGTGTTGDSLIRQ